MSARRRWTDDELGFIQDHTDWTAARIAEELVRSEPSVTNMRKRLREGWSPIVEPYTIEEDLILLDEGRTSSAEQLAQKLPGRSVHSIRRRRQFLGIPGPNAVYVQAHIIGGRPLLAKTCRKCERLLQADWFSFNTRGRAWMSECRKCMATRQAEASKAFPRRDKSRYGDDFKHRMKQITQPRASRNGEPYTEQDHPVLADADLTLLQKALRLGRTYDATANACASAGYKSHVGLGEPTDLWRIFNPNQPEQFAA